VLLASISARIEAALAPVPLGALAKAATANTPALTNVAVVKLAGIWVDAAREEVVASRLASLVELASISARIDAALAPVPLGALAKAATANTPALTNVAVVKLAGIWVDAAREEMAASMWATVKPVTEPTAPVTDPTAPVTDPTDPEMVPVILVVQAVTSASPFALSCRVGVSHTAMPMLSYADVENVAPVIAAVAILAAVMASAAMLAAVMTLAARPLTVVTLTAV